MLRSIALASGGILRGASSSDHRFWLYRYTKEESREDRTKTTSKEFGWSHISELVQGSQASQKRLEAKSRPALPTRISGTILDLEVLRGYGVARYISPVMEANGSERNYEIFATRDLIHWETKSSRIEIYSTRADSTSPTLLQTSSLLASPQQVAESTSSTQRIFAPTAVAEPTPSPTSPMQVAESEVRIPFTKGLENNYFLVRASTYHMKSCYSSDDTFRHLVLERSSTFPLWFSNSKAFQRVLAPPFPSILRFWIIAHPQRSDCDHRLGHGLQRIDYQTHFSGDAVALAIRLYVYSNAWNPSVHPQIPALVPTQPVCTIDRLQSQAKPNAYVEFSWIEVSAYRQRPFFTSRPPNFKASQQIHSSGSSVVSISIRTSTSTCAKSWTGTESDTKQWGNVHVKPIWRKTDVKIGLRLISSSRLAYNVIWYVYHQSSTTKKYYDSSYQLRNPMPEARYCYGNGYAGVSGQRPWRPLPTRRPYLEPSLIVQVEALVEDVALVLAKPVVHTCLKKEELS